MGGCVLVVDDDPDIREMISRALREAGYRVDTRDNGASALAWLESSRPSMMLLDLLMPVMGGWQLLDIVASSERLADIPIVVITASNHPTHIKHPVLKKPFDLDDLLKIVGECGRP